ncbi:MAG: hypothetical protein F4W90_03455 [Gammaproteobacteria bacterium]|nr:hypothetical protein [Gammaproteobacteria bacterium]
MESQEILGKLAPLFDEMDRQCMVTEHLMDKDRWRVFLTTMWSNLVLDPENLGMTEEDLESAFNVIESEAERRLGGKDALVDAFRFLTTKDGERCMDKAKLRKNHRDMLVYFASMMVDPERHKQYMQELRGSK